MNELMNQQLSLLIEDTDYEISILSNAAALLKESMNNVSWVGFYLYQNNELCLGPFQGKVACTRIPLGKGVCGNSAADKKTYLVPNVHEFPGHIACDSASNSEIVIPILLDDQLYGVLDIDSASFDRFTKDDQQSLEEFVKILANRLLQLKQ
ncbi:MAG: GAF domain-containing protein [Beduini sp.]|uniref:GAF domain-containing protein n=1 Tax=Beduini sp. TaxID=1922300 RepID=UPI00399F6BC8